MRLKIFLTYDYFSNQYVIATFSNVGSTSLNVVINLLDSFREVIDWIDCSLSTDSGSKQSSLSGLWDSSAGLSCQFGVYQKRLVRSFSSCHLERTPFITIFMVFIFGASSLC